MCFLLNFVSFVVGSVLGTWEASEGVNAMWPAARHHVHRLFLPDSKRMEVGVWTEPMCLFEDELGVEKQQGRSRQ